MNARSLPSSPSDWRASAVDRLHAHDLRGPARHAAVAAVAEDGRGDEVDVDEDAVAVLDRAQEVRAAREDPVGDPHPVGGRAGAEELDELVVVQELVAARGGDVAAGDLVAAQPALVGDGVDARREHLDARGGVQDLLRRAAQLAAVALGELGQAEQAEPADGGRGAGHEAPARRRRLAGLLVVDRPQGGREGVGHGGLLAEGCVQAGLRRRARGGSVRRSSNRGASPGVDQDG